MSKFLKKIATNQKGATAIEYGMLAALIVLVILTAIGTIGNNLNGVFGSVGNQVKAPGLSIGL